MNVELNPLDFGSPKFGNSQQNNEFNNKKGSHEKKFDKTPEVKSRVVDLIINISEKSPTSSPARRARALRLNKQKQPKDDSPQQPGWKATLRSSP